MAKQAVDRDRAAAPAAARAKLMRAVFAACKDRGLDESARHDVTIAITGRASLKECTLPEIGRLLDHLNRGTPHAHGKARYEGRRRSPPAQGKAALMGKIDALLAELHRVTGVVHNLAYADAIARKLGVDRLEFCDVRALGDVVAALNRTLSRRTTRERAMTNPFKYNMCGAEVETIAADDRIKAVKDFSAAQCIEALRVPFLQRTVERAIHARQRQLAREAMQQAKLSRKK
ncbi:MAG: regulatory protein GemA [Azoarcus sp.]|jgi:phage gp16-like protein|nr:regulatory protein GemA [Azoarcus sp.]